MSPKAYHPENSLLRRAWRQDLSIINKSNYVLAMYDVRGKQNFIYRSTHIKEIIGGSDIIRTIFQRELYDAAKEYRNSGYNGNKDAEAIYDYHKPAGNKSDEIGVQEDVNFKLEE